MSIITDAPKVRKVLSSKPISTQAAHDLLSRFLEAELEDGVVGGVDEVLTRLEVVCRALQQTCQAQESSENEQKRTKWVAKRKRRSEESSRGSKKRKKG